MPKTLTATELRRNLYGTLDEVLETGVPREIERKGETLVILPVTRRRRLADFPKRKFTHCSLDELAEISWEDAWNPDPA